MQHKMLTAFEGLFRGKKYEHRKSTHGDYVASFLFEDLLDLGHSSRFVERIGTQRAALNTANRTVGKHSRRGDGTFGEIVPGLAAVIVPDFAVPRSQISSVEIGVETKILAKAMIKQIDRVINDLRAQTEHFKKSNPEAICVAIVGVNSADSYLSHEGTRSFETDGKTHKHPVQEASQAIQRLNEGAKEAYNEFLVLPFRARNVPPYDFDWVNEQKTKIEYASALSRISKLYDKLN